MRLSYASDPFQFAPGEPAVGVRVLVAYRGTKVAASIYLEEDDELSSPNPQLTDEDGIIEFWAKPGYYTLWCRDVATDITIGDPDADPDTPPLPIEDLPVIVYRPGDPGPEGPPGPAGGENGAYEHTQTVSESVWNIDHQLGFNPAAILVITDDDFILDGFDIQYMVPLETLRLTFDSAYAGKAYLS